MQINWFTVVAQVLNFLLLAWLLKRYLYMPILDAIDVRENKIKSQLENAALKEANALKEQEAFKKKNESFEQEKIALREKVLVDYKNEGLKIVKSAHSEAEMIRKKEASSQKLMKEKLDAVITQKIKNEVITISKKTLQELATQSLETQCVQTFILKLHQLDNDEKASLKGSFQEGKGDVVISSAFELTKELQLSIQNVLLEILSAKVKLRFEVDPKLIGGIQLYSNGYKLAWNISEYIDSIQNSI